MLLGVDFLYFVYYNYNIGSKGGYKMIKICQECGKEFEATNGMQKFCKRQHYRKCKVCGSQFPIDNYHLTAKDAKQTCSKKCSVQLRKQTNLDKYGGIAPACSKEVRDKMEATNLDRYGVEHAAQAQVFKDKSRDTNLDRYGVEYYTQTLKSRQHMSNLWKDAEYSTDVRAKIAATNLDRYGVECSLANPDVRNKSKATYHNRTGYSYPLQNPAVMSKMEATNLARFGCKHPMQNSDIVNKFEQTNVDKYGCKNPMQNKSIKIKAQTTNMHKYGNACFLQSEEGKHKTRQSMMCKYGVNYFSQSIAWKSDMMLDATKINNLTSFRRNPDKFISNIFSSPPTIKELSIVLGVAETTAGALVTEFNLEDKIRYVYS